MIMKLYIIQLALIRVLCQCLVNKKSHQIIFIDKLRELWVLLCNNNINNNRNISHSHNISHNRHNIIHKPTEQWPLTKFIQMLDRDFIPTLMRFHLRLIIRNMMLINITFHLLTHTAWSKVGRHQIVPPIQDNL